jgi:Fic family protein
MPRTTGTYETTSAGGEDVRAFVPHPLPPTRPALKIVGDLASLNQRAETGLAALEAAGRMVPSLDWFVYSFVRKEAVISSQIEGTQASLDDLLATEAEGPVNAPPEHVEEICNYLEALRYARGQLRRDRGLPLSVRLLNETHKRLMTGVRGQHKRPGRIRTSQNWIGGTRPGNARFVPPPPHRVADLLGALEEYLHTDDGLPPLVRAGLVHAQFETIHPYLDGNGRVGRLLIALCLEDWRLLGAPLLYLSLFFKRHRDEYYDRLGAIRADGDWEGWTAFFLEGVADIANEATQLVRSLFEITSKDRVAYLESRGATVAGARLFELLPRNPLVTTKWVVKACDTTPPTASKAIASLCAAGILEETSGRKRDRLYAYRKYLDLLKEGTEL